MQSIEQLGVSSATTVSTPHESVVNISENQTSSVEEQTSREQSRMEKLRCFNNENYNFLNEINVQLKEQEPNGAADENVSRVEDVWMETLIRKEQVIRRQKPLPPPRPPPPTLYELPAVRESSLTSILKSLRKAPAKVATLIPPQGHIEVINLSDRGEQEDLSDRFPKIREKKKRIENNLSSSKQPESSTKYMDFLGSQQKAPAATETCSQSAKDDPVSEEINNIFVNARQIGLSKGSGVTISRPVMSKFQDSPETYPLNAGAPQIEATEDLSLWEVCPVASEPLLTDIPNVQYHVMSFSGGNSINGDRSAPLDLSIERKSKQNRKGWFRCFMNRHKDLALRTPEAVTSASAKVSEKDIRGWFQTVKSYLIDNNLLPILDDPSRILNGDETGFTLNPIAKQVVVSKGIRNVPVVEAGSSKTNITVMFTFCADGTVLPPDVILAQKRLSRELIQSFPKDWGLGTSPNGWMDTKNFVLYIKRIVYPFLVRNNVRFPVLYFVDGHKSHTSFEAAEACRSVGIILVALFPNATRILQPADVAAFRPLKSSWEDAVELWKTENPDEPVDMSTFGSILHYAMPSALKQCTIIHGFAACGLYPFNPDAVDYTKCIAKYINENAVNDVAHKINVLGVAQYETVQYKANETIPDETVQEATAQQDPVDAETVENEMHYLVSARAIEQALEMIGPKIQMFEEEDADSFSAEDKILAFIYKNILMPESITPNSRQQSTVPILGSPNEELCASNTPSSTVPMNIEPLKAEFFGTVATPKRSAVHKNFKHKTYAVLTAEERLQDLMMKDKQKEQALLERKLKAEQRQLKKLKVEEEKKLKRDEAMKRRREKEMKKLTKKFKTGD